MKKLSCFLLFLCCLGLFLSQAQNGLIRLTELSSSGKKAIKIDETSSGIIDINSSIDLQLQLDLIETAILNFQGLASNDSRLLRLQELNRMLKAEVAINNYINTGYKEAQNDPDAQLAYFQGLNQLGLDLLTAIAADTALYLELLEPETDAASNAFDGNYVQFMLFFLNQKADELRQEILASLGLSEGDSTFQVYFRLGAFLRDRDGGRPIHVENFDDYDKESYQEIARFGKPISDKEQVELRENAKLNNQLGAGIDQSINQMKGAISAYKKQMFGFREKFRNLNSTYKANLLLLRSSPNTLPAADVLMDNSLGLNLVESVYATLFSQYEEILQLFSPDVDKNKRIDATLSQLEKVILKGYEEFSGDIQAYLIQPQGQKWGKNELELVRGEYKAYVDTAQSNISNIRSFMQNLRNAIRPFRKAYLENEKFSDQVKRYKPGEIPASGLIELNYIGSRSPGDEILIKASLERGTNENDPNFESKQVYRKVLKIQRINPYIRMSGSIILANPYTRDEIPAIDLENNFQFAPTYGIILKWGSRKNNFYNNFVNLGLGFAFSSPDFNTDGTPEFGAGVMVTAFRDILSAGWGWNFGMDAPYSFVGFNIPFNIGGLPSGNNNDRLGN
ncbi:MAG: hypothetical protein R8P61_33235 [Bacteroidia bacterium]|nr:hypothetical protein [Bacteroidia bacterium]